ncbi:MULTISPECIES: hypothetical protein [unclassified Yoonia]|uniref:hypothetical protein n=1 Tax=unclassified Yoonia TaxID=2629118 RepID=UPI002AFE894E|nr:MULTISPECIES: hypothetical protein [unclassified Yoonia]
MSNLCPFPQHAARVSDAAAVVLSPGEYTRQQRLFAWACLKTARGQTMHQSRVAAMAPQERDAAAIYHPALIGGAA